MKVKLLNLGTLFLALTLKVQLLGAPLGTAFTYQGRLQNGSAPANGQYEFSFALQLNATGAGAVAVVTNSNVAVSNGLFTTSLDFGPGLLSSGNAFWLEVGVRTNGSPEAFTTLSPRQALTPAPYAQYAPTATYAFAAGTAATASQAYSVFTGSISANQLNTSSGPSAGQVLGYNGSALVWTNGGSGASATGNGWTTNGNSGTSPTSGNYLGTSDNQPLELRVNGLRAFRLEPDTNYTAPNVIGGASNNCVDAGVFGAVIGGGGSGVSFPLGYVVRSNHIAANFGTIAGGYSHTIQPDAILSFIGGGGGNTIQSNATDSFIGGGIGNTVQTNAKYAVIVGGLYNTIQTNAQYTVIGGGYYNTNGASYAVVPGGYKNAALATNSLAAGQRAKATNQGAFVWADSQPADFTSTTNDQFSVRAQGGVRVVTGGAGMTLDGQPVVAGTVPWAQLPAGLLTNGQSGLSLTGTFSGTAAGLTGVDAATVGGLAPGGFWQTGGNSGTSPTSGNYLGTADNQPLELRVNGRRAWLLQPNGWNDPNLVGGPYNAVDGGVSGAAIAGGSGNNIQIGADYSTVGGGLLNTVQARSDHSFIGGGRNNSVQSDASLAVIAGGEQNTNQAPDSFIGGGSQQLIQSSANYSGIGGGYQNSIQTNAHHSVIGGGYENAIQVNAQMSSIDGGSQNTIQTGAGFSAIGGGINNTIQVSAVSAVIGGGSGNAILANATYAAVGGGWNNTSGGQNATVPGGMNNSALGGNSFAAGANAQALHNSTFVWSDGPAFKSSAPGQFLIHAYGGVGINTTNPGTALQVNGTMLATYLAGDGYQLTNLNAGSLNGFIPAAQIQGTYTNWVFFSSPNNSFIGNGSGLSYLNASALNSGFVPDARLALNVARTSQVWLLGGNTGATPDTNYLGTADNQPLEVRVNGARALRLEPNTNGSPNVIGGSLSNLVDPGIVGAFIGGGGTTNYWGVVGGNRIASAYGVIGGGILNAIQASAEESFIGGGYLNSIQTGAGGSVIGGGANNALQPSAWNSVIGGGAYNTNQASATYGFIGGGMSNALQTSAQYAVIAGGLLNRVQPNASYGALGGGGCNTLRTNAYYATIPGGLSNVVGGNYSFAAGRQALATNDGTFVWADSQNGAFGSSAANQFLIRAGGGVGINKNNPATALDVNGTVTATSFSGSGASLTGVLPAAGSANYIQNQNASAQSANLWISGTATAASFSGSGSGLTSLNAASLSSGTVADARLSSNVALLNGSQTFTGSPTFNGQVTMANNLTVTGNLNLSGGGRLNDKTLWLRSGTDQNHGLGWFSSGTFAGSNPDGPVLFGCGGGALGTTCSSQVIALAWNQSGNVGIGTTNPTNRLHVVGGVTFASGNSGANQAVVWTPGSASWSFTSDRNAKTAVQPVNPQAVLEKVAALPINEWNYIGYEQRHIGPMAQDFHAAFPLNDSETSLNDADLHGVELAAIQGLNRKLEKQNAVLAERNAALESRLNARDVELEALKQRLEALEHRLAK